MAGSRLYDIKKRESALKSVLPILNEMAERDEIETAVISIVKRSGEIVALKFGMTDVKQSQAAVGALEIIKAGIISNILLTDSDQRHS